MTEDLITTGAQTVTAAGPVTPTTGLDISGFGTGGYQIELWVFAFNCTAVAPALPNPGARIVIEDSVNAFTAAEPVWEKEIQGTITAPTCWVVRDDQIPLLRLGVSGAKLRANVVELDGTSASLTLQALLRHN
jgi:hypothetical protein